MTSTLRTLSLVLAAWLLLVDIGVNHRQLGLVIHKAGLLVLACAFGWAAGALIFPRSDIVREHREYCQAAIIVACIIGFCLGV